MRISKDYEQHTQNSETMIYLAMINLMLHRIAPGRTVFLNTLSG